MLLKHEYKLYYFSFFLKIQLVFCNKGIIIFCYNIVYNSLYTLILIYNNYLYLNEI